MATFVRRSFTIPQVILVGLLFRLALLLYGEWQDANFAVKFTDIDYHVFSDASYHVTTGRSPYLRPTYRYTPLLALMLVPNHLLFFTFGKLLFISCDLVAGWIIYKILCLRRVEDSLKVTSVCVWLLNPLTATISARGNAESLLAVVVLSSIYFLLRKQPTLSAIALGTAIHIKIFPVIYLLPILFHLNGNHHPQPPQPSPAAASKVPSTFSAILGKFVTFERVQFALVTATVLAVLTGVFYGL